MSKLNIFSGHAAWTARHNEAKLAREYDEAKLEAAEAGAEAYAATLQHLDALHAALDADARYED